MIKLNEEYYIQDDQWSWNLVKKTDRLSKDGKVIYYNLGYYTSVDQAMNAFLDLKMKDISAPGIITIKEFVEEYRKMKDEIKGLFP